MDEKLSRIHQTLQRLTGLHRQLLDVVRSEREALLSSDLKAIQEVTCLKEALIESIRHQEAERLKLVGELSAAWKTPMNDLTILSIAIAIQAEDPRAAESFRTAYNALSHLIARIKEQNGDNRRLVDQALHHTHVMKKNVLGESAPYNQTYTAHGKKADGASGSRLISKEA